MRTRLTELLRRSGTEIADRWIRLQRDGDAQSTDVDETELRREADRLLDALTDGLDSDLPTEHVVGSFGPLRDTVVEMSQRRARLGATPAETAAALLNLKEALLDAAQEDTSEPAALFPTALFVNRLLDAAGTLSFETYLGGREEIISRQSRQLSELSTPVVQLWQHILAVPLIGTLDTARTQVVMESLLQAIQEHQARVAIIDITGVPTVDTAVAQHLMSTVGAVRLMGADCVISGIRPPIAQTITQLGIDLSGILTRATLADALATAVTLAGAPPVGAEPAALR
ncbi:STAS domain-containing protein [Streptomyces sp. 184]|uniref:STAS domain-containing protein n=1 Tax=Streptomyces sp. 184 TaxID=1827526 RepID=UPI0038920568